VKRRWLWNTLRIIYTYFTYLRMYNGVIEVAFWLRFLLTFYPLFPVCCKSNGYKRRRRRKIIAARKILFANSYRYIIEFEDIYREKRKYSMLLSINEGGGLRQPSSVLCVKCVHYLYTRFGEGCVLFIFFLVFLHLLRCFNLNTDTVPIFFLQPKNVVPLTASGFEVSKTLLTAPQDIYNNSFFSSIAQLRRLTRTKTNYSFRDEGGS